MRAVLLARSDGYEQARVALQGEPHRIRKEGLQVQRSAHVVIPGCLAGVAAAEWLHGGGAGWVWTAAAAAAAGLGATILVVLARPRARIGRRVAPALAALASIGLGAV